jgi:hypothetical protein
VVLPAERALRARRELAQTLVDSDQVLLARQPVTKRRHEFGI